MAEDWDLQAVVRGCTATSCSSSSITTTTASPSSSSSSGAVDFSPLAFCGFKPIQDGNFYSLQDLLFEQTSSSLASSVQAQLHDNLFSSTPYFPKSSSPLSPKNIPISPLSVLGGLQDLSQQQQQHHRQNQQKEQQPNKLHQQIFQPTKSRSSASNDATPSHHLNPRSKRRKNQLKRVCQVAAEALSSDMWSWRKYGQKPIKGSPYPRGYYRCSTSKGCLARKQVERNRSDPGMFIVTYTAEHNHPMPTHRNSLAGSSRQKPAVGSDDPNRPLSPPLLSPGVSLSPAAEKLEIETSKEEIMEDEDDGFNPAEMALDDDFFDGLEELNGNSSEDYFSDHNPPPTTQLPWLTTTPAAGGS